MKKSFLNSEQGAVLPLIGIVILLLLVSVGVAVDMGRASLVKSKAQTALDSAVLAASAAGRPNNSAQMQQIAQDYFNANFPQDYLGATYEDLQILYESETGRTSGSVDVDMPTVFGGLIKTSKVEIGSGNEVIREGSGVRLEVTFAFDMTGTMCDTYTSDAIACKNFTVSCKNKPGTKYRNLIDSTHLFLDELQNAANQASQDGAESPEVHMAGIFFDQRISNSSGNALDWPYQNNPENPNNPDAPPAASGLKQFDPSDIDNSPLLNVLENNWPDNCKALTRTDNGTLGALMSLDPDPEYTQHFNHDTPPGNYDDVDVIKVMVLLTDGANNKYIRKSEVKEIGVNETGGKIFQETVWYEGPERDFDADAQQAQWCTEAKAAGVNIYPFMVGTPPDAAAEQVLRDCASKPENFFQVNSEDEMRIAFQRLATSILNLRITK